MIVGSAEHGVGEYPVGCLFVDSVAVSLIRSSRQMSWGAIVRALP
jgi:hypothetical protein